MPQDRITDPNWGLPPAAAAPVDPASARVTDPNWGSPGASSESQPHYASTNELDPEGHSLVRDLGSAWTVANTPLVPQIGQAAHALADVMDRPMLGDQALNDRIPGMGTLSAMIRGGYAGMVEGAGDVATTFTAPMGIALYLAGMGEASAAVKLFPRLKPYLNTPALKALQRTVQGVSGAGFTGEGARTILHAKSGADFLRGLTQMAGGTLGMASAVKPPVAGAVPPAARLTADEQAANAASSPAWVQTLGERLKGVGLDVAEATPSAPAAAPAARSGLLSPEAQASNVFAEEHGIPLDPATATGSKWIQALQMRLAHSMGGQGTVAERFRQQSEGLTAAGRGLAAEVHPDAVTAEQAGQALEGSLVKTIGTKAGDATTQYDKLEAAQADPRYAAEVPAPRQSQKEAAAVAQKMRSSLGYAPNPGELAELRRMAEEMGALPYVKRTWNDRTADVGKRGNAAGGDFEIVAGAGGAPVYDDILASLRSTDYVPTRNHVERMIRDTLESGQFNEVSKAAFDVAQRRLANDPAMSKPSLPPSAGDVPEPPPVTMGMPVALKPLQDAVRHTQAELQARHDVVPLMGSEAEALRILTQIMQAPEFVPVTVADKALGSLKRISAADVPGLRTEGQGIAAQAVKALSAQIDEIASQVPGASEALAAGRRATVEKHAAANVLDQLKEAPVATFKALTASNNGGLHLLRQLEQQAPEVLPQIARAKLDQMLNTATTVESGKFQHAARIASEWEQMGAESKAVLYGDKVPALNEFFLLVKRIAGQPLGSDTAYKLKGFDFVAQLATIPLTKILYSPTTLAALNKFARLNARVSATPVSGAAREAAWAGVAMEAQKAGIPGVPYQLPLAAQADQPDRTDSSPAPAAR